jgi:SAM-dependent methyltransferase
MDANKIDLFRRVSREVHPRDEMFHVAKLQMPEVGKAFHYYFFTGGLVATRTRDYLVKQGVDPGQSSLLDFGCGYGRITRYFALVFREVVCSDLEPAMIAFAKEQFGVDGFVSAVDLAGVAFPPQRFDVVFSFSLFTHLNPEIWPAWFWALSERVRPGGHLLLTTRSPEFARRKGETFAEGERIQFRAKNETGTRLDARIYGQTTASRDWVESVAAQRPGELEYLDHFPSGSFDLYQDMHVFRRHG